MGYVRVGQIGCGLAVAALVAGCGPSTASHNATATGSSSAVSSAASTSPPPSAPQLQTALVQASDLPTGWTSEPHQADPGTVAGQAAFLQCVGARDTTPDQVTEQDSPDFSSPTNDGVSSTATSFRSQQDITDDVAALNNPKVSTCFEAEARTLFTSGGLPPGAMIGTPQITITPGNNGGPNNVVAVGTGTVPLTVSGQRVTLYFGVAFITGRMTESEVDTISVGQPLPATLLQQLTKAVATRTAAL